MMNKQEESNIALSAEHEALCNSKNTLNKKLCRQTMGQLPKFESDINTYFKEKFNIDGFKLTGINFPYDGFNHGGFHATFQLESDPYVMITDTFDYDKDKYIVKSANSNGENEENAGRMLISSAILMSSYFKTLPLDKFSDDLENLGISTEKIDRLYYGFDSGRYFTKRNIVSISWNAHNVIGMSVNEQEEVIQNYITKKENEIIFEKYKDILISAGKINPMTYAESVEVAKQKYEKYISYLEKNSDMKYLTQVGMIVYSDVSDISEGIVYEDNSGEVVINE